MVSRRPECGMEDRYNQSQAASLLGVERHTIKRWEANGYIRFWVHKASGKRFTTGQQIDRCWEAAYL